MRKHMRRFIAVITATVLLFRGIYVLADDGKIVGSYTNAGVPIVGGSVIKLANDGRISDIYHYYCKN